MQCQANKSGLIVKLTYLQTARESHDLNMDFRSFDNGFNEFYARMYVYIIIWHYKLVMLKSKSVLYKRPVSCLFEQM